MINVNRARAAIQELLASLDVPGTEHTRDTPARVARSWADAVSGYDTDPDVHLKTRFPAPPDAGLIVVSGIRVISTCAHHMLPITGHATVTYRPNPGDDIVGLSKLARLVDGYAHRLQIQEMLGWDIATALMNNLEPIGAGCIITATHGCMTLRGVLEHQAVTTTYAFSGNLDGTDVARAQTEHAANRGG